MANDNETTIRDVLDAYNERRWDDFAALYANDAEIAYPQSGERFVGRDTIRALMDAFPSPPTFTIGDVRAADDLVVVHAEVDYGTGEPWRSVLLYTVDSGRITEEVAYFAQRFEPADWREPFREE